MQVDVSTLGSDLLWPSSSDDLGANGCLSYSAISVFSLHLGSTLTLSFYRAHAQLPESSPPSCLCGNPPVNRVDVVVANSLLVYRIQGQSARGGLIPMATT